jgi:Tol biopolymer transport system component
MLTKLTETGDVGEWEWTPDGERIAFGILVGGRRSLAWQRTDGSEPAKELAEGAFYPCSWSPDGRQLLALHDGDLWAVRLDSGKATREQLTRNQHTEWCPTSSPDGSWLADTAGGSGRPEVYLQAYSGARRREQVSIDGGRSPRWNPDGRELFFLTPIGADGKRRMMSVDIPSAPTQHAARPRPLFEYVDSDELSFVCFPSPCYDVSRDGQRFFVTRTTPPPAPPPVTHINLVQNWVEELNAKVPTR